MAVIYLILLIIEVFILYLLMRRATSKIFNLIYRLIKNKNLTTYIFAIIFLPGTFIHEMSHFLVALFLLVPVGQIELMPKFEEREIKMGSVPVGKTDPIRRTLIGIAPIILGMIIIFVSTPLSIAWYFHAYIAFEVGNSMFSSKKDLEGVLSVFIVLAIIFGILYYLGLRVNINIDPQIFKMADLYLLVPIGIDAILSI